MKPPEELDLNVSCRKLAASLVKESNFFICHWNLAGKQERGMLTFHTVLSHCKSRKFVLVYRSAHFHSSVPAENATGLFPWHGASQSREPLSSSPGQMSCTPLSSWPWVAWSPAGCHIPAHRSVHPWLQLRAGLVSSGLTLSDQLEEHGILGFPVTKKRNRKEGIMGTAHPINSHNVKFQIFKFQNVNVA